MFFNIPIQILIYGVNFYCAAYIYLTSKLQQSPVSLVQWFGLFSLTNLYISLLISPLYYRFPTFPFKKAAILGRQAFGICACIFAVVHGYVGFYGFIGGFAGLTVWSLKYKISIIVGAIALGILTVLAITSFSQIKRYVGVYWKRIHRMVYVSAVLILIHSVTITIHLFHLTEIMIVTYIAIVFLLFLESHRLEGHMRKTESPWIRFKITGIIFPLLSGLLFWSFFGISHHTH